MAFWGSSFQFDGIPSDMYNLYISSPDDGEVAVPSANVELFTESIYQRPKVYLYGVQQTPVLEFPIKIFTPGEIDNGVSQIIQRWLFGRMQYKKLYIMQNDMTDVYFNCIINQPEVIKNGNIITGFNANVVCDSPFAWEYQKSTTGTYTDAVVSTVQKFINLSDNTGYLYPTLQITMNILGGDIYITNLNDSDRVFSFTGLSANEVLTVNNEYNTIVSSTGLSRIATFNKKWMRFVPGLNELQILGSISSLKITYQFARKIGG